MAFQFTPNPVIEAYCLTHTMYAPNAYYLVERAVAVGPHLLKKMKSKQSGHMSGAELLEIIRLLVIELYGPFGYDVLEKWNVRTTNDFGNIVFEMVRLKQLGVSDKDSIKDFDHVYDFVDVFVTPFKK